MKHVLLKIANEFMWVFREYGFRIVDSGYHDSFGGQGTIVMQNDVMRLCFVSDRERVDYHLYPESWPSEYGITTDILYEYLKGEVPSQEFIQGEGEVAFLRTNFERISKLFAETEAAEFYKVISNLKKNRAKRLFS